MHHCGSATQSSQRAFVPFNQQLPALPYLSCSACGNCKLDRREKQTRGQATRWQAFIQKKSLWRKCLIFCFLVNFYFFSEAPVLVYLYTSDDEVVPFSVSTTLGIFHLPDNCHDSWLKVHYDSLLKNLFLFICIWTCLVSLWVYVMCTWVWVSTEARRRHCIPWTWRYRQLQATQSVYWEVSSSCLEEQQMLFNSEPSF